METISVCIEWTCIETTLDQNDRKAIVPVYLCDCSFGEIPIMGITELYGSCGLFIPCLIKDLFVYTDYKQALFAK